MSKSEQQMVLRNANCGLTKTWKIRIPPVVASVDDHKPNFAHIM